ncbi:MAG: lysylphosphatidylglycerol synthase transmembrane domain-containing protein, partial [Gemmatimonadota bacterium]|nr:lysylphosphatidylglycerol synthase transmembrane domain-containing protein [Gemmatimonadota bacterium]
MKRQWGMALVGALVTVLLLWWVLRGESLTDIIANITQANFWLLSASISVGTFGYFIRALRWKILLTPVKADTALRSRFASVSIAFMANNLLPARVGDLARAYAFSRLEPVSASAAFGSLVVERFMDGVVLLLFLIIPVYTSGFPSMEVLSEGWGAGLLRLAVLIVIVVTSVLCLIVAAPRLVLNIVERCGQLVSPRVGAASVEILESFISSLKIMRDVKLLLLGFTWTLAFWTWHALSFWLGMLAFGIDTGFISAIFTAGVVAFAVALPAAPGFFGTFH